MHKALPLKQAIKSHLDFANDDIRMARLLPIPAMLKEMQCDPDVVLASIGFDPAMFEAPDARVPYTMAAKLLAACAEASGVPHFGLLLGLRFDLSMFGTLNQLVINADTVKQALQLLIRHLHLNDKGATAFLHEINGDEVALGYTVFKSETPGALQVYSVALASICEIMRILCGPSWQPIKISIAHDEPPELGPYQQVFRAPLEFNAFRSEVVFANRWLKNRLQSGEPLKRISVERLALQIEANDDQYFVMRVRRIIYELLMAGKVTSPLICARLNIHERVLRRNLRNEGTSIKDLISTARHELARQLLSNTQLSVAEIAQILGYSDVTAFSRAYRGWEGIPPDRWRRQDVHWLEVSRH